MITDRSGLNGSLYIYYDIPKIVFVAYTSLISLTGLVFIVLQLLFLFRKSNLKLTLTFMFYIAFLVLFTIFEIYLRTRFIGKC